MEGGGNGEKKAFLIAIPYLVKSNSPFPTAFSVLFLEDRISITKESFSRVCQVQLMSSKIYQGINPIIRIIFVLCSEIFFLSFPSQEFFNPRKSKGTSLRPGRGGLTALPPNFLICKANSI